MLFPRSAVPRDLGVQIRRERLSRGWSQERLARRTDVDRRTIIRLEQGAHRPSSHLVHALEEALGLVRLVPGWADPAGSGAASYGPRSRLARLSKGLTLAVAARAAGVSPATLSRYEREMGDTPRIVAPPDWVGGIINEGYARILGFEDAADMDDYCNSSDPDRWLWYSTPVRRS